MSLWVSTTMASRCNFSARSSSESGAVGGPSAGTGEVGVEAAAGVVETAGTGGALAGALAAGGVPHAVSSASSASEGSARFVGMAAS